MKRLAPRLDQPALDAQLMADLWVFRTVGRYGSITAAADRLGVTQGAVSQRILRLEARLAMSLFSRGRGSVCLTQAGSTLLAATEQSTQILADALSEIDDAEPTSIVVNCAATLAAEWLAPRAEAFRAQCGIEILIRSETMVPLGGWVENFRRWMEDEKVDVAIQVQQTATDGLERLAEFQDMIFPACSPDYADRVNRQSPDQRGHIILHNDLPCGTSIAMPDWAVWTHAVGGEWLRPPLAQRYFNVLQLAYQAAIAGEGVTMARAVCANRLIAEGRLQIVPGACPIPATRYMVLAPRPGRRGSSVRRFAKWLAVEMARTRDDTLARLQPSLAA